ncbi:unnamed protein product [Fraxinus pennsylvanica]|uniref:Uncharacterized protein n=1 Tax=Fraxinus pennsylvanica TaxID=56036 RepID=A0AAD1YVX3_9LAMI|nr:unnamed protein product [Fraxinus pennsylvanica]
MLLFSATIVEGMIGLNWGRMTSQRLIPSTVVDLFLQNGIPRYVNIGAEPFSPSFWSKTYLGAVDVLKMIQDALNEAGYGDKTKATTPHLTDILKPNHTKPSEAEFHEDIKDLSSNH